MSPICVQNIRNGCFGIILWVTIVLNHPQKSPPPHTHKKSQNSDWSSNIFELVTFSFIKWSIAVTVKYAYVKPKNFNNLQKGKKN